MREGGRPETQSWMDFTAENQIGTDFLIPHFLISKLQPAQPQKHVAKGGGIKRVREVGKSATGRFKARNPGTTNQADEGEIVPGLNFN